MPGPASATPFVGPGRRLAAVALDVALAAFALAAVNWMLHARHSGGAEAAEPTVLLDAATAAPFALPVILLCWYAFQGTPGKLLLGARIADARSGGRPRPWQLMLRLAGYAVALAPAGLGLAGVLWDRRRQGWHDKLSRTAVIVDDDARKSLDELRTELG
jgi:uncharacterized RDD family membrane protein YckC